MPFKKIINNLYLGDKNSIMKDSDLIISCAEELFEQYKPTNQNSVDVLSVQNYFWLNEKRIFLSFPDFPLLNEIDESLVEKALQLIKDNIEKKKIYIHCIWGINRSASIVFMYLVANGKLNQQNFDHAFAQFEKIYPHISPNPGWHKYLVSSFPYNNIIK